MKYVLMFAGSMDDQNAWENQSKEELAASYARVGEWFDQYAKAGKIVGGEELKGPQTATTVHFKNGKTVLTDGPFIESKEVIGGFAVVEVADLDEAIEMAKRWPGGKMVEVRPVVEH
jgi:hypothetical protein